MHFQLCAFILNLIYISKIQNHAQNVRARYQSEAQLLWRSSMACSVEEVNVGLGVLCFISYAKFSKILEVPWDSHRFFGSRNSPTISILHIIRHVYRSVWPAREAEPRFGAALVCSAHDYSLICSCVAQFIERIDKRFKFT